MQRIIESQAVRAAALAVLTIALCAPLCAQPGPPVHAGSAPVTVVNTQSNPVPAKQAGTWTVNVGSMPAGSGNVTVVNSASQPVPVNVTTLPPVSGSVNISGTANVNVTGTPAVSISGTPSVNVGTVGSLPAVSLASAASVKINNTDSSPVPVRLTNGGGTQRIQRGADVGTFAGQTGIAILYVVPSDKWLVIEYFSSRVKASGILAGQWDVGIKVRDAAGVELKHWVPLTQATPPIAALDRYVGGQALRLYAAPGTAVEGVVFNGGAITLTADFTISGYLEPAP